MVNLSITHKRSLEISIIKFISIITVLDTKTC